MGIARCHLDKMEQNENITFYTVALSLGPLKRYKVLCEQFFLLSALVPWKKFSAALELYITNSKDIGKLSFIM